MRLFTKDLSTSDGVLEPCSDNMSYKIVGKDKNELIVEM